MSQDEEWWWWASRQGDLKTVDGKELRAHLRSGVLAADVLVWREGWAGWLAAAEVADLADALPRHKVRTPVEPKLDESVVTPPKPPLDRYQSVAPPPKPQVKKRTLLGLPTSSNAPRPAGPPRPATTPLRPGGAPAGRTPGAPPRPLSTARSSGSASRPPPPRRPSGRPPPPRRPSGRPPPPKPVQRAAQPEEEVPVEIDAELEDVSSPAATAATAPAPDVTEPMTTKPDAAKSATTQPDGSPAPLEPPPAAAAKAEDDAGASSVRPSRIIPVGGSDATAAPKPVPIIPAASDPDHEAPTRLAAAVSKSAEPIVPVPSDPDNELPTLMIPPVDGAGPIIPVPSDPDHELPTQVANHADLESEFPTHIKLDAPDAPDAPDDAPLPSWELPQDSSPGAAAPPAPLPAFPVDGGTPAAPPAASPGPYTPPMEEAPSLDAFIGRPPGARRRVMVVGGILGACLLVLGIAGVASLFHRSSSSASAGSATAAKGGPAASSPHKAAAAAGAAKVAKPTSHAACTLGKHGVRLADKTAVRVPPYLATAPGGDVALGFATTPTAAIGVKVDPASLDLTQEFSRDGEHNVLGVVPLVRGKKLDFAVDRDGSPLQSAHTVDASPPFILGVTKAGVSRAIGYGEPETIWPGAGDQRITEPRVVSVKGVGHAVTFRRGGRDGEVRVGWLTPDGDKKTDLVAVKADGPRVGTPNIAANDHEVLVAFAARPSDDAAWTVRLAHAPLGKAPSTSEEFDLPGGGPGGDAISPAAVGLPGGRWLIQWTEGKAGSRAVRAQTLDAKLQPIGKPVTLSPEGRDSGQGALWAVGQHALSVFLVRSDSGYELWGAGLDCP